MHLFSGLFKSPKLQEKSFIKLVRKCKREGKERMSEMKGQRAKNNQKEEDDKEKERTRKRKRVIATERKRENREDKRRKIKEE